MRRTLASTLSSLFALALLFAPAPPLTAQEPRTLPTTPAGLDLAAASATTALEELEQEDGQLLLSLEDALALTLRRNVSLMVQRYLHSEQLFGVRRSQGIFDLRIDSNLQASESTSPTTSTLEDADLLVNENQSWNFNLSRLTDLGGTASLRFNSSRGESSDRNASPNPLYTVNTSLNFVQPLLRGFGSEVTRRGLIVAHKQATLSREDFQTQVEQILQQASDGYWNLVQQLEQLKVAEESLALAVELHELNQRQVDAGTLAPLELLQSESGVASRRLAIIRIRAQVGNAEDTLRELVHLEDEAWDLAIRPTSDPAVEHRPIDRAAALATAFEKRPDMRRRRLRNEILEIDARVAKNGVLPRLDVNANYGLRAVEGDTLVRDTDERLSAGFSDALEQITDASFDSWTLSLQLAYPLQNRDARASNAVARIASDRGQLELRELELRVRTEVRRAVRVLESAAEGIESARIARGLAEQNLEAARLRYEHGILNSLDILRVQEDLSGARRDEVGATLDYRRAETAFHRALGQLLEHHGIVLAVDETP